MAEVRMQVNNTCRLPQIAGIPLNWKGCKVMWKLCTSIFSWVTPHLPTLRDHTALTLIMPIDVLPAKWIFMLWKQVDKPGTKCHWNWQVSLWRAVRPSVPFPELFPLVTFELPHPLVANVLISKGSTGGNAIKYFFLWLSLLVCKYKCIKLMRQCQYMEPLYWVLCKFQDIERITPK